MNALSDIPSSVSLESLTAYLNRFLTPRRQAVFQEVLSQRTRHFCLVAENIYQPQNASALIRSCDVFGLQDFCIVERNNSFALKTGVSVGSERWVDRRYFRMNEEEQGQDGDASRACVRFLREQGYRIVATSPHAESRDLSAFSVEEKAAVFVGNEMDGLTPLILDEADDYIRIPMTGFAESLNLSVSAAIILHSLREKLNESSVAWQLSPEERQELYLRWALRSIKKGPELLRRFLDEEALNEEVPEEEAPEETGSASPDSDLETPSSPTPAP